MYDDDDDDLPDVWAEPDPWRLCVDCDREASGDVCGQCGGSLCHMHAETGAGFCKDHPDKDFEGFL